MVCSEKVEEGLDLTTLMRGMVKKKMKKMLKI